MVKISNSNQFAELVAELKKNPTLAKGFRRGAVPTNFKSQWQGIATKLNALGPPLRDAEGWQKVWRDFKCKVKRKLVHNKKECHATGGGVYRQLVLSPLEEEVANLVQFGEQLNPKGVAHGVRERATTSSQILERDRSPNQLSHDEAMEFDNNDANTTADSVPEEEEEPAEYESATENENSTAGHNLNSPPCTSKRSRNRQRRQKQHLLQNHTAMQESVLTKMSSALEEIGNNVNSIENIQYDTSEKMLEIEREKLKIMQRQEEREERLHSVKLQIKQVELDIIKIKRAKEAGSS